MMLMSPHESGKEGEGKKRWRGEEEIICIADTTTLPRSANFFGSKERKPARWKYSIEKKKKALIAKAVTALMMVEEGREEGKKEGVCCVSVSVRYTKYHSMAYITFVYMEGEKTCPKEGLQGGRGAMGGG